MTDSRPDGQEPSLAAPKRRMFRSRGTPLAAAAAERQSRITLMAWELLGPDAAIAFLNNHQASLAGRPLDLAVASAAGCEIVEQAIAARAER